MRQAMTWRSAAGLAAGLALLLAAGSARSLPPSLSIADSHNKHNLSASGPTVEGGVKTDQQICVFCHTPHHATDVTPLWNRELSGASYTPYQSTTIKALPGQPTGGSRLCLSCHDGTIALGMLSGGRTKTGLEGTYIPPRANLSTDLSDDHPISFDYQAAVDAGGPFRPPAELTLRIPLENGRMECTSCHDPHRDIYPPAARPLETGKFLRIDNSYYSTLCTACHNRAGLTEGVHYTAKEACEKCHVPHKAPTPMRLLREATNQDTCLLRCHNSTSSLPADERGPDIRSTFLGAQAHLASGTMLDGAHDAAENPAEFTADMPHVECVDCHNPCLARHETTPLSNPPNVNGRIENVLIARDDSGTRTFAITEFQICFKCHGKQPMSPPAVPRQIQTGDMSKRFASTNPSYHPVVIARTDNPDVPGLLARILDFIPERFLDNASMIYCTDCHNSSASAKSGRGTGPSGPHGSAVNHLLIDNYEQDLPSIPYADFKYDLCYRCHDKESLLNSALGQTNFPPHYSHVVTQGKSCSICHDPHGIPQELGGTQTANAHLINFDTRFVLTGTYNSSTRSCTVSCHAVNPKTY